MNSLLNQLGGRKFVCVAGLVAAAAGSVYMYKRIWGSEEALVITDEQVLTMRDLAVTQACVLIQPVGNPDQGQPDQDPSTVLIYEEVVVPSGQLLPWRYSPLYCGPLAIRTNTCRVLMSCERIFQFQTAWSRVTGSKKVETKMHHVCVVRGADCRLWWAMSVERWRLTPEGYPYTSTTVVSATGIQLLGGQVRQVQSHLCQKTSVSIPFPHYWQTDVSIATATLFMGPDGKLSSTAQTFHESLSSPTDTQAQAQADPQPDSQEEADSGAESDSESYTDSESESDSESVPGSEAESETQSFPDMDHVSFTVEEIEVPYLNYYFASRNLLDFPLKLAALREAFSTLLSNEGIKRIITEAGRLLLSGLVDAGHKEQERFYGQYDRLTGFFIGEANKEAIAGELAEEGIQHVNFIDILYELVLLGMLGEDKREPAVNVSGGVFEELHSLLQVVLPAGQWQAQAQRYLDMLKAMLLAFLDAIFNLPLDHYSTQETLQTVLLQQLRHHLQGMVSSLRTA